MFQRTLRFLWILLSLTVTATADPFAYITNNGSNNVSVIDTANKRVIFNIPVGDYPTDIAINPTGTRAYVTNIGSGDKIAVIDTGNDCGTRKVTVPGLRY